VPRLEILLDATELRRDWLLEGFRMQLLATRAQQGSLSVSIPPSVLEELIAHHDREAATSAQAYSKTIHAMRRLGFQVVESDLAEFDYRAYLLDRFEEILNFEILDWPSTPHQELVARAVQRRPPFDVKGGGYRDALVWANALELAAGGAAVVLVSADRAFADSEGNLHPDLRAETEELAGSVLLVQDLTAWLLSTLPVGTSIVEAVQTARDQDFADYYFQSDIQTELFPSAADIGFSRRPIKFEPNESEWGGDIRKVSAVAVGEGSIVAEYDIDQIVSFRAVLPDDAVVEPGWEIESQMGDEIEILGRIDMVVRMVVLFDPDTAFAIDEVSWRRADGAPPGLDANYQDPSSVPLF
jgi:hypothetical protein